MFDGFDTFSDHAAAKRLGQADDALHDGQVIAVVQHVADEALVDLERARRQALEIGERGITRAKVVQRKIHPERLAFGHQRSNVADILERCGFQQFDLKAMARQPGVRGEEGFQAENEVVPGQMVGRDIDADDHLEPGIAPRTDLAQRFLNDPFAQRDIGRTVLDHTEKLRRHEQAALGMLPADQCLGTDHAAAPHVDFRLVM